MVPEPAIEMRLRRTSHDPDTYEAVLEDLPAIRGTGFSEEEALASLADFIRDCPPGGGLTAYGQVSMAAATRTRSEFLVYLRERRAPTGAILLVEE